MSSYELMEWRDRRYQHVRFFIGTRNDVIDMLRKLNKGYTGQRFTVREVSR